MAFKSRKTRPHISKEQYAYERIREAIFSGEFAAGETLVQTRIAVKLGVSVIPVRAAIRRLMSEGHIVQEHHHPPKVAKMAITDLEETRLVREHLEAWAIKEAVPRIESSQLKVIAEHLSELDTALHNNDMPQFASLNKRFHLTIYQACPYRLVFQMIRDLWERTDRYGFRAMFSLIPHLAQQSQADHQRLVKAIEQGAAEEAARLIVEHNSRARRVYSTYLRSNLNGGAPDPLSVTQPPKTDPLRS